MGLANRRGRSTLDSVDFDTATKDGRKALAAKLAIPEADVLSAIEAAGFTPYTTLSDKDIAEILRSSETSRPLARTWQRAIAYARRAANRRCRSKRSIVVRGRMDCFGHTQAPFGNDAKRATDWIQSNLQTEDDELGLAYSYLLWLDERDQGDVRGFSDRFGGLLEITAVLCSAAGITRREGIFFMLTGDVQNDAPVRVKIEAQYGCPARIVVEACDHVPAQVVAFAFSQARQRATGRQRAASGVRRASAKPPPPLHELLKPRELEDVGLLGASAKIGGQYLWQHMAPGMQTAPTHTSMMFFTADTLGDDGESLMIPDVVRATWELEDPLA
jgi:hypothetical protein